MKAVILAGGLGTRLHPYTFFIPKPMLPLGNKPVLEHIIEWVKESGEIDGIILSVSYLYKLIENYFENGRRFGVDIRYVRTDQPMGTAGQLKAAEGLLTGNGTFVCLSSDHVYKFKLDEMMAEHLNSTAFVSMALLSYKTLLDKSFVHVVDNTNQRKDNSCKVIGWEKKSEIKGLINIGCYIFEPEFLNSIPSSTVFPMNAALRKIIREKKRLVKGFLVEQEFIDIGDKQSYRDIFTKFCQI